MCSKLPRSSSLPYSRIVQTPTHYHRSSSESSCNSCLEGANTIPSSTSLWSTCCLEKLGIYYNDEYHSSPQDILDIAYLKTGCFGPMTDDQKLHIETLQDQLFLNFSIDEILSRVSNEGDDVLKTISLEINRQLTEIRKYKSDRNKQAVHTVAEEFICDLAKVLRYEIANANYAESRLDQGPVTQALYLTVFDHFARMCHIDVLPGSLWTAKKMLCNTGVTSISDLLLTPLELSQEDNSEFGEHMNLDVNADCVATVTVMEAKKRDVQRESGLLNEASLATHDFCVSNEKHSIHEDVDLSILGQHGGQLLMYRQFYEKKLQLGHKYRYCPGILVMGTKVIFTLLETTSEHLSEVYTVENVQSKAKIYYSEPEDILKKEDRDLLMEAVIRLNNVK